MWKVFFFLYFKHIVILTFDFCKPKLITMIHCIAFIFIHYNLPVVVLFISEHWFIIVISTSCCWHWAWWPSPSASDTYGWCGIWNTGGSDAFLDQKDICWPDRIRNPLCRNWTWCTKLMLITGTNFNVRTKFELIIVNV